MPTIIVSAMVDWELRLAKRRKYSQEQVVVWALARACRYGFRTARHNPPSQIVWSKPSELFAASGV